MKPTDIAGYTLTGGYLLEIDGYLFTSGRPGSSPPATAPVKIDNPDPPAPEQYAVHPGLRPGLRARAVLAAVHRSHPRLRPRTSTSGALSTGTWSTRSRRTRTAYGTSTWMYKPRGQRLAQGPVWDFDNSLGTTVGWVTPQPTGWWVRRPVCSGSTGCSKTRPSKPASRHAGRNCGPPSRRSPRADRAPRCHAGRARGHRPCRWAHRCYPRTIPRSSPTG